MMTKLRPTGITADRKQRLLLIRWNDGHESRLPYAGLRAVCPCVECRGGHAHMGQPPDTAKVRDTPNDGVLLEKVEPMGSYALQLVWDDGHYTGIYTWTYLRQADPALSDES